MSSERPRVAFTLTLIGGILMLISAILVALLTTIMAWALFLVIGPLGGLAVIAGIVYLILAILTIVAAAKVTSGDSDKVRTWSIVALVIAVISLVIGCGFIIGPVLVIIGSILGLTWSSEHKLHSHKYGSTEDLHKFQQVPRRYPTPESCDYSTRAENFVNDHIELGRKLI